MEFSFVIADLREVTPKHPQCIYCPGTYPKPGPEPPYIGPW